jgi:MoaA/NifB/PqqE/SkfB family radical SAM enzyme
MKSAYAEKLVRNLRNLVATNANRMRGREFIPAVRDEIYIETSSVCNLDCRFCAYAKKQSAKVTMKQEMFENCVGQALAMGYRRVELTPCTGDVFMDRGLFRKLRFLEAHPDIQDYSFHTNCTVPDRDDLQQLMQVDKLKELTISIYGCDADTFKAITLSTDKVFQRLLDNLDFLLRRLDQRKFALRLSVHPARPSLRGLRTEMTRLLDAFARAGVPIKIHKGVYNNWGGYIGADDVRGLDMEVVAADTIYKNGACVRLMTTIQIMATGIVNGCACRDVDATLQLGDINETPLRDIISSRNPVYMNLIDGQQRGEFPPVCHNCDFYSSILHRGSGYRRNGVALESLAEFKARLA